MAEMPSTDMLALYDQTRDVNFINLGVYLVYRESRRTIARQVTKFLSRAREQGDSKAYAQDATQFSWQKVDVEKPAKEGAES